MIKSVGISKPKNNKDSEDDDDNSDFASNNRKLYLVKTIMY